MNFENFKLTITKPQAADVIACIMPQSNFHVLATSYIEAAKMLFKHLDEDGLFIDFGVHPICFLFRHSLELTFKQIVWDGRRLLGEQGRIKELCRSHDIQLLWTEIETIMKTVWPEDPCPDEALLLREVVYWFHAADPGSFAFRYPFDKKLQSNLTDIVHINLSTLIRAMETSSRFLDGVGSVLSEYLSEQRNAW